MRPEGRTFTDFVHSRRFLCVGDAGRTARLFTAEDKFNVMKTKVFFHRIGNIVGEKKCWLPAFFSFSTMSFKGFFLQCVKSRHFVVKG